ncbi:MAG: RloB domain-containing protein, partial [Anaerolineae bacterium]
SRRDYQSRLSDLLGYRYVKNSNTMYDALLSRQGEAIRNAERLLSQYDPPDPAADNPSTTVHLLVKELNRFAV